MSRYELAILALWSLPLAVLLLLGGGPDLPGRLAPVLAFGLIGSLRVVRLARGRGRADAGVRPAPSDRPPR